MIFKIEWSAMKLWEPGPDHETPRYPFIFLPPIPITATGPAYVRAESCFEALQRFGAWYEDYLHSISNYQPKGYVCKWNGPTIKSVEEVPGQLIV